jgi:hypothetical protein
VAEKNANSLYYNELTTSKIFAIFHLFSIGLARVLLIYNCDGKSRKGVEGTVGFAKAEKAGRHVKR